MADEVISRPFTKPMNGPHALCTHSTNPPSCGMAQANSAPINPIGSAHTKGKISIPTMDHNGPDALTACSE